MGYTEAMARSSQLAQVPANVRETLGCDEALTRAFGFLGKRWNGVLLGTLGAGTSGFSDLKRAVSGISDTMLSQRLCELARAGLVQRTVDVAPPITVSYTLTPAGLALVPVLQELTLWAQANLPVNCHQDAGENTG